MLSYKRDTYCGQVTENLAGKEVHLSGWVQRARDLGGVVFVWTRPSVPTRCLNWAARCARNTWSPAQAKCACAPKTP